MGDNSSAATLQSKENHNKEAEVEKNKPLTDENKKEDEDKAFKKRLVTWLKQNELKISPKNPLEVTSSSLSGKQDPIVNTGHEPKEDSDQT